MPGSFAVVTDSTASLPTSVVRDLGIRVVPLQVVIGAASFEEGVDDEATPEHVADALRQWQPVSTSRPTPALLAETYAELAEAGAEEIVSVHLSGEISGTVESAEVAAREAPVRVHVVDTRQVGMAAGLAVVTAAEVRREGGTATEAADAARRRARATTSLFYVDTLEYLRRGGRIGSAAALLGSALAVKPLLRLEHGRVGPFEKVRTSSKALSRLEEVAVEAAADHQVDVAVAHLASPARAEDLAARLAARLADQLDGRDVWLSEVGAVLGAHVGPGMVAVVVAPRDV